MQITTFTTLSSSNSISPLSLLPKLSTLSLTPHRHRRPPSTVIRMGGGPRTYPGGVSKWQWKRMQAKKSKQLLKARLARERQIYEMRKRAELKAAVYDLERPWEVVSERPGSLFAVSADEQLKVLADRFVKPGGFDLWSENDGPQVFWGGVGGGEGLLPSGRFFPEGAVHSVKPYGVLIDGDLGSGRNGRVLGEENFDGNGRGLRVGRGEGRKRGIMLNGDGDEMKVKGMRGRDLGSNGGSDELNGNEMRGRNLGRTRMRRNFNGGDDDGGSDGMIGNGSRGRNLGRTRMRKDIHGGDGNGGGEMEGNQIRGRNLGRTRMRGNGGSDNMERNEIRGRNLGRTRVKRNLHGKSGEGEGDVFDLSLQRDGRYGFSGRNDVDNDNYSV